MAHKEKIKVSEEVAPNLVPMIDIMFLLLLFFMLSADMGQRELEEVLLPKAHSLKEDKVNDEKAAEGRLTINVYHKYSNEVKCQALEKKQVCRDDRHWLVGIKGVDYSDQNDPQMEKLRKRLDEEAKSERKDPKTNISERK